MDTGIYWIARVEDEKVISYEAFNNVHEAFVEFNSRLAAS